MKNAFVARLRSGKNPEAGRAGKLNGRKGRLRRAAKAASSLPEAFAQSEAVRALNEQLVQQHQQRRIADLLIEHLVRNTTRLEERLEMLTHREAQARRLAHHDALTGLPNRALLQDRFRQAMSQAKRHRKLVAMLFVDLDGFKNVNDTLGHDAGDKLLCAVAARLVDSIRGADTVCRYGGDEFVIMLPEVEDPAMAAAAAEKIRAQLSEPGVIDGHQIRLTASIGTALYPVDGKNYEQLIKHADHAMYGAKDRNCRAFITPLTNGTPADLTLDDNADDRVRSISSRK
jgi:diguanylate cyclase (GGDEF)-like protein